MKAPCSFACTPLCVEHCATWRKRNRLALFDSLLTELVGAGLVLMWLGFFLAILVEVSR